MLGGRLGASSALSPPLRYGRKHLVPPPTKALQRITTPRCQQKRSLSMPHKSSTSRRPSPSGNVIQRSGAATAIRSQSSAAGGSGSAGGEGVGKRAQLVVAGVVSVAAATLARERQLPEDFAEWDDQVCCSSFFPGNSCVPLRTSYNLFVLGSEILLSHDTRRTRSPVRSRQQVLVHRRARPLVFKSPMDGTFSSYSCY